MNKWYSQIGIGLALVVVITILNNAFYPPTAFTSARQIAESGDPRAFYFLAVLSVIAQGLILVGFVRGFLAMVRKFRNFARIKK